MFGGKEPDSKSPTFNYQRRQTKLVSSVSLLSSAVLIGVVYYVAKYNLAAGIAVAFAALYSKMHYVAAASSDAVFDSLWERINLQSRWLDVRLRCLEIDVNRGKPDAGDEIAQEAWQREAHEQQLSDAWHMYPEKDDWKV
ncbi:MAG TPA: hypothetical protein VF501_05490 [Thiobacillus sp.]